MKIKYILTSFIATMLIIYGCQKQNTNVVEPLNNSKILNETTQKILIFKDKMEKAKQGLYSEKSGDGMVGIDSAEWYLEAAINYTYDEANEGTPEITWRSKTTTLTLNNDEEIDMLQLAEAYDVLIAEIVYEGEYLAIADITTKDDGNKAGSIEVILTAGTAKAGAPPPPSGSLNFENYWHWDGTWKDLETGVITFPYIGSGYCDPPNNQIINNRAATDLLSSNVRNNYPFIALAPGEYWVDVASFFIRPIDPEIADSYDVWWDLDNEYLLENPGNTAFPWLVYRLFTTENHPCMSPDALDFYINQGVFTLIERLKPSNTVFGGIITSPEAFWGEYGNDDILMHTMRILFGRVETSGS